MKPTVGFGGRASPYALFMEYGEPYITEYATTVRPPKRKRARRRKAAAPVLPTRRAMRLSGEVTA